MSQNHRNSNPIYLLGAIVGLITVLTYMGIKPYSTLSVETTTQPTPESTNKPTQDPTPVVINM
ncbi:MAG: hypothetical protein GDA56_12630 [Hormoscilla sp. GM7CHS1pb]|nr:hypothetical protein [Hormoscilla sp. GM7CHS1pb]